MRKLRDGLPSTPPWNAPLSCNQTRISTTHRRAGRIEAGPPASQAKADSRARILEAARRHPLAELRASDDSSLRAMAAEWSKLLGAEDAAAQTTHNPHGPRFPHCPPDPD
jgi:hypothetical protein